MGNTMKRILLTAAMLCVVGCAKSEFPMAQQGRSNMRSYSDPATANVKDEKPPKILPETHFAAGMLFERQGQVNEAILQYRKAVALNHNYVAAYHRLGLLQSAIGKHFEAAQSFQSAVALRPDNAVLRNDLGFERMRAQQWDEAELELRRAIELQPDLATAHINLAMVQAKSERFAESLASFQAVLPEADAYYNLGLMLRGQKRYAEAVEAFRHVLTVSPEFSAAKTQLEQLAAQAQTATPTQAVVEAPKPESIQNDASVVQANLPVEPELRRGVVPADAPTAIAVIEVDAQKVSDPPIDRPVMDDANGRMRSQEVFIEVQPAERPVEKASLGSPTAGAIQEKSNDAVVEEKLILPIDAPTVHAAAETEELRGDTVDAVAIIEEPLVDSMTLEPAESPAPCDAELVEIDADEVIVALPSAPTGQTLDARESLTMLEELEAKIAMLRLEVQATMPELTVDHELALMYEAITTPPTWIDRGMPTIDDHSAPATVGEQTAAPIIEVAELSAVESVEEPPVFVEAAEEIAGPTGPSATEIAEADADDVIDAMPFAAISNRSETKNSWAMLEELETKVALLRQETKAAGIATSGGREVALMNETTLNAPIQFDLDAPMLGTFPVTTEENDDDFDVYDAPSVEIDKNDAIETIGQPARTDENDDVEEGTRKSPAPSNRTSLWTTEFGELTNLLAIVLNETACLDELDAESREVLTFGDVDWPCVEGIEQSVSTAAGEFSPAIPSEADDSIGTVEDERRAAGWTSDHGGNIYATPQRGLKSLPN